MKSPLLPVGKKEKKKTKIFVCKNHLSVYCPACVTVFVFELEIFLSLEHSSTNVYTHKHYFVLSSVLIAY
jgi:hypothetical protein